MKHYLIKIWKEYKIVILMPIIFIISISVLFISLSSGEIRMKLLYDIAYFIILYFISPAIIFFVSFKKKKYAGKFIVASFYVNIYAVIYFFYKMKSLPSLMKM